jgi:VWFA-related protein
VRFRVSGLFLLPAVIFCGMPLCAQSAPSGQGSVPVFKTHAQAVVVDVVVTKGNGKAVPALRKQAFQIIEDGKPQTIDYFEEHTAKTLPPGALPAVPKMPPNVYTNVPPAPESDAVNVLLLDSLNTEEQDQSYVRQQILDFLKNMQPGTRCAIFTLGSKLRFVQGFTTDNSALLAALNDKKNGVSPEKDWSSRSRSDDADDREELAIKMRMMNGNMTGGIEAVAASQSDFAQFQIGDRAAMTMEALQYLARYLGGIPGRKNLIWFASSFPVTIFPTTAQRESMGNSRVYANDVKETADLLTGSKVAVYPIGAEGVMVDHWMDGNSRASGGGAALNSLAGFVGEADRRAIKIMAMEQLANDTGGKAYFNTNDLNAAMTRAINDGSHYYTLAYTPTNKKMDGSYRRIEIKLAEGKYKLAYRRGYNADDSSTAQAEPDSDPLQPLLLRGLPGVTELLYGVRVVPAAQQPAPGAKRVGDNSKLAGPVTRYTVDFMIRWTDVALSPAPDGTRTGKILVELMAYDRDGNAVNWVGETQGMSMDAKAYEAMQKSGVPAHLEIDLPNSDVTLETGVYDWDTGKAGTLEIPIHFAPTTAAVAAPHAAPNTN